MNIKTTRIILWLKKYHRYLILGLVLIIISIKLMMPFHLNKTSKNKEAEKYVWNTWKDSTGGLLAHDPNWFKMPRENLQTKPISYYRDKNKDLSTPQKINNDFFNHICSTEEQYIKNKNYHINEKEEDIAYLRNNEQLIKNIKNKNENEKKEMKIRATQYLNRKLVNYMFYDLSNMDLKTKVNKKIDFNFNIVDNIYHLNSTNDTFPQKTTFKEFLSDDGKIYRVMFNKNASTYPWGDFMPMQEVNELNAHYYKIWREIERPDFKKYGVEGRETILFDRKQNRLVYYSKNFYKVSCSTVGKYEQCNQTFYWGNDRCNTSVKTQEVEEL